MFFLHLLSFFFTSDFFPFLPPALVSFILPCFPPTFCSSPYSVCSLPLPPFPSPSFFLTFPSSALAIVFHLAFSFLLFALHFCFLQPSLLVSPCSAFFTLLLLLALLCFSSPFLFFFTPPFLHPSFVFHPFLLSSLLLALHLTLVFLPPLSLSSLWFLHLSSPCSFSFILPCFSPS